jgi:glycosyltransferase involved in cell wall biosynthesis
VAEYYALADVFVSSSVREGLPIVLLEAMAAELPIIATDIPGVEEVLDTGTGEFVGTHAPSELAEAMIRLGSDKRRISIGKAGYETAIDKFSIQRTVNEHIELYKDCTKI